MTYKNKAKAYFNAVNNYDVTAIRSMLCKNYIQHNPYVPTGREAFLALIPKLKQAGSKINNLAIFEDGAFVIMLHRWTCALPLGWDELYAFHIIRFDEEGLIAEHWSVMTSAERFNNRDVNYEPTLTKIHRTFTDSSFKLVIAEGKYRGVNSAIYKLSHYKKKKLEDQYLIAQPVPTTGLANNNTMFGFNVPNLTSRDLCTHQGV